MADTDLQLLLDPYPSTKNGFRILRRYNNPDGLTSDYYIEGNVSGVGKACWVTLTDADSDADHNTAIRAAFGVA